MRARVVAESLIVAVATCTSPAQSMSAPPTRVGGIDVYVCPPYSRIPATWPVRCPIFQTPLTPVQPLAVMPVGASLGPFIEQEFRERSGPYSYAYPPYPYPYPPEGYYYNPSTGSYYRYRNNGYYSPNSGQYYQPYYYQPPGYFYPNNGFYYPNDGYPSRPNEEHRERDGRAEQKHR
jgi:hypothetical protein